MEEEYKGRGSPQGKGKTGKGKEEAEREGIV